MTNELLNEWKKEKIVEDGDIVLAGVSGGADSVCLLLMLEQLQKKTDFLLEAVHVEHGIRGEESRKDAAFVKNLCQDHGIRCHIFSVEVPLFAEKHGLGLEEAARILRYDCYKKAAESVKKEFPEKKIKLALAHHAEDNAETVLFQMVRGSGLDGLCGVRFSPFINPLLFSYSGSNGLSYRQDFRYNRIFRGDKWLRIVPKLGYNFTRKEFYWSLNADFEYWPQKRGFFRLSVGPSLSGPSPGTSGASRRTSGARSS